MKPTERDLIVSLGTNCEIAYNLRKFYKVDRTGLFDWLITPIYCLPELIENRFRLVDEHFKRSLVLVKLDGGKDSVLHMPTGILLYHAFTRDKKGRVSKTWRSEINDVAEKFAFLGDRMHQWLTEARAPALFLNRGGQHEALTDDEVRMLEDPAIYANIIGAYRRAYIQADPTFCVLNGNDGALERVRHRPDVRAAIIGNQGDWHEGFEGHYAGCKTAWREGLASLQVQAPCKAFRSAQ